MEIYGTFPFGQQVKDVVQTDRTSKGVFVLGVYSSAVHARWESASGKTIVTALAVANEPYIFWRGDYADSIIERIPIPKELGKLISASENYNGPSGKTLDNLILKPLRLKRQNVWLCDLVPHSCVNPSQQKAIEREYIPIASKYDLPKHSVPSVSQILTDEKRRKEILNEILESRAKVLIVLGDKPIEWFLSYYENRWSKLSDFGRHNASYGKLHEVNLDGFKINLLPIAHPRQIGKLGMSSAAWYDIHNYWIEESANSIADLLG